MKKLLIATAALAMVAGTAQAQSSVTVYGIVDAGITETTVDTTTVSSGAVVSKTDKTTGNGSAYTSQRLGFRGTEDLGGGLKANFVYEFGIADSDGPNPQNAEQGTDTASPTSTRVATVGLSGAFGTLDLGRQTVIADKAWGVGDVGSGNNFIGRAYTSSAKLNNSRSDRLINYVSPAFSGFTIHAAYGERDNENSTFTGHASGAAAADQADSIKETGLGLQYSAGALNAFVGYSKEEHRLNGARLAGSDTATAETSSALAVSATVDKVGSDPKQLVIGANYDFKMAKAFVTYAAAEDTNEDGNKINDKKVMEIGVAIPFGKTTLQLSAFDGENKASTAAADLTDISGYQVGVLHAFSKRTTGYVVYGAAESKVPATKTETEQFGFGIRHAF
jgi:predicted porin